jgi:hypothetical protein
VKVIDEASGKSLAIADDCAERAAIESAAAENEATSADAATAEA